MFGKAPPVCVSLTKDLEFEVFVKWNGDSSQWVQLGRVSWRSGPNLPRGKVWCPAMIFMPRKRMGRPQCAVPPDLSRRLIRRRGGPYIRSRCTRSPQFKDRFAETPHLSVLDLTSDSFSDMPVFDSATGTIIWKDPPAKLCNLFHINWTRFEIAQRPPRTNRQGRGFSPKTTGTAWISKRLQHRPATH